MDKYTIYCTPEQTRKALELGAPIDYCLNQFDIDKSVCIGCIKNTYTKQYAILPTAEQMIGWLEEQGIKDIEIGYYNVCKYWHYNVLNNNIMSKEIASRKEATLAAIDAALEYLTNNKK